MSGPEHGSENLFNNKWCILIKEKKTNIKNLKMLSKFWKRLGSKIVIMDAKKHDLIFSLTSHLPHLIAFTIVSTAFNYSSKEKKKLLNFLKSFDFVLFLQIESNSKSSTLYFFF